MQTSYVHAALAAVLVCAAAPTLTAADPLVTPTAIASAKTAVDHEAIARTYDTEADRLEKEAATQAELARIYGSYSSPKLYSAAMEKQCIELARDLKASATLNRELATLHRKLAAELGSK